MVGRGIRKKRVKKNDQIGTRRKGKEREKRRDEVKYIKLNER